MEERSKIKYTTVHIPTVLAKIVDEVIENGELAYASRSEFIKDAIRRFLEYYGYYPRNKQNFGTYELHVGSAQNVKRPSTYVKKEREDSP